VQVQADTGAFPDWGKLFSDEEIADQASTPINATESQVDQQMMEGTGTQEDAPAIFTESQVDQQMMEGTGTQEDAPAIFSNPQIPTEGFNLRMPWKEIPDLGFFGSDVQWDASASRKRNPKTQNDSVGDREAEAEVQAAGTSPSLGSGCTGPLSMVSSKAVEAGSPQRGGRRQMFSSNPRAAAFPAAGSSRRARDTSSCRSHRIKTTPDLTIADQPSMRRGQSSANSSSQNNLSAEVLAKRMKLHESQVT